MKKMEQQEMILKRSCFNSKDAVTIFVLCAIVSSLLASIVAGLVVAILQGLLGINHSLADNKYAICLQYIIFFGFMMLFLIKYSKKNNIMLPQAFEAKRTTKRGVSVAIMIGVICVVASAPLVSYIGHLFARLGYSPTGTTLPLNNAWDLVLNLVFLCLLPAVCEELIYRGAILKGLNQSMKGVWAITLTSVIFMLAHGSLEQSIYQLILGFVLTYITYMTGNILYSMIIHFTNNASVVLLSFLQNMTTPWLIDFTKWYNIVSIILGFVIGMSLIATILIVWTKKVKKTSTTTVVVVKEKMSISSMMWLIFGIAILIVLWIAGTAVGF